MKRVWDMSKGGRYGVVLREPESGEERVVRQGGISDLLVVTAWETRVSVWGLCGVMCTRGCVVS